MKLDNIKWEIKNNFDLSAKLWAVFTGLNWSNLIFEKWILFTDKTLQDNLNEIYKKFVENNKKVNTLVIDVIKNINEITSVEELQKVDLLKEWIFVWDVKNDSWSFILPDTNWIKNIKQVIDIIKQKVEFSSKNVNIYKFETKRFVFTK